MAENQTIQPNLWGVIPTVRHYVIRPSSVDGYVDLSVGRWPEGCASSSVRTLYERLTVQEALDVICASEVAPGF